MSEQNNGGPAFPSKKRDISTGEYFPVNGMTLRDYFAAKAMQELAAKYSHPNDLARNSYAIADAMLKARG